MDEILKNNDRDTQGEANNHRKVDRKGRIKMWQKVDREGKADFLELDGDVIGRDGGIKR